MDKTKPTLVYLIDSFGEDVEYYKPKEVDEYTTELEEKLKLFKERHVEDINTVGKISVQSLIFEENLKVAVDLFESLNAIHPHNVKAVLEKWNEIFEFLKAIKEDQDEG